MQNELLNLLTKEGVLVKVSISFWRGHKKLKAEDLGLRAEDVSDRLISLGHKRLLPKDATAKLALIEGRAHAYIESNTFPFLNNLAHFVTNARLDDVMGRLKDLEDEFWKAKAEFLNLYGSLREKASVEWRTMAEKLVKNPDQLVSTIEASFPLPHQMDSFFGFKTQLFQITVPERLGIDFVTRAEHQAVAVARQRAAQDAAQKIRSDIESFMADCVASLREQTAQICHEMLESIKSSETGVHQKTLNRLVRFIEQFKGMNFLNDHEMERQLENVRKELLSRTAEEYRDNKAARARLMNGLRSLGEYASNLAKADATELVQRFGEQGKRKFHLAA